MRLNNGRYQCLLCGAVLPIPTDHEPQVVIRTSSGMGAIRTIRHDGKDVHSCPISAEPKSRTA